MTVLFLYTNTRKITEWDNAGITRNLAKMWEEYAKARGLTAASLTQTQKVEAEYLGILKETEMQVGDLAKASDSLAGAQAENAATATELATAYGSAMAPAMQGITEATTGLFTGLKNVVSAAPSAASGITAAAGALALLITGMNAASSVVGLFSAGTLMINPVMIALASVVGIAAGAYTHYKQEQDKVTESQTKAAEAAEAERKANEEKASEITAQATELHRLGEEYRTLTQKENRTKEESERLEKIIGILTTQYGISEAALRDVADGYYNGNLAIQDRLSLYSQEILGIRRVQEEQEAAALAAKKSELERMQAVAQAVAEIGKIDFSLITNQGLDPINNQGYIPLVDSYINELKKRFPELTAEIWALNSELYNSQTIEDTEEAFNNFYLSISNKILTLNGEAEALQESLGAIQQEITGIEQFGVEGFLFNPEAVAVGENTVRTAEEITAAKNAAIDATKEELKLSQELEESYQNLQTLQDENASASEKQAAASALEESGFGYLLGNEQGIKDASTFILGQIEAVNAALLESKGGMEELIAEWTAAYEAGEIGIDEYVTQLLDMTTILSQMPTEISFNTSGVESLGKEAKTTTDIVVDLKKEGMETGKKLKDVLNFRAEVSQMKDLAKQVKSTGGGWDDLSAEVKAFAKQMGVAEGDLDGTITALEEMEAQTGVSADKMVAELNGTLSTLENLRAELMSIPPAELTADATQALSVIDMAIKAINFFLSLAGKAGIDVSGGSKSRGGGGGGGGSRSDTSAQDAAREAERAQEEAYRAEIERIEHRRHLGQITAQQEISELERVKREYARTAEQIMDIDERIYDARQALRDQEEEKIDTLYDSIVDALEERYEEQRDIEQKRIQDSIKAWEKWSDDTCAAIQKQIDALDEQVEAEDRAAVEAENLRKIASLEQALAYEKDEYNQQQLLKQIEQAQEAWADIQKGWAVEDQREALEDQMKAVQDQAKAEVEALEKESERIDSVYDEMLKGQSLAAEAQKLLMEESQEDLLDLLVSYAPEYEATGRTLGEKIYEGFKAAFGDISKFFESIDAQFEQMAENAGQAAFGNTQTIQQTGQASANITSPTINQTVNFNQPVESPADVTRRMQQVSEDLAGMI